MWINFPWVMWWSAAHRVTNHQTGWLEPPAIPAIPQNYLEKMRAPPTAYTGQMWTVWVKWRLGKLGKFWGIVVESFEDNGTLLMCLCQVIHTGAAKDRTLSVYCRYFRLSSVHQQFLSCWVTLSFSLLSLPFLSCLSGLYFMNESPSTRYQEKHKSGVSLTRK